MPRAPNLEFRKPLSNERREDLTNELCQAGTYFVFSCTPHELQKMRNISSRMKIAPPSASQVANAPGAPSKTKTKTKKTEAPVAVPVARVKADHASLKALRKTTPATRKLSDSQEEAVAQKVSETLADDISSFRDTDGSVSKRIDRGLKRAGLAGKVRGRAKDLTARKSVCKLDKLFQS